MGRTERITRELKTYDDKLFCGKWQEGKLAVFRKGHQWESYVMDDNSVIHFQRPAPFMIFCLTHNWLPSGHAVDWGLEPIMKRIKDGDLWKRDIVSDIEKNEERISKEIARERMNKTEDFLHEFRSDFKKTFNDVNTSNMKKVIKEK